MSRHSIPMLIALLLTFMLFATETSPAWASSSITTVPVHEHIQRDDCVLTGLFPFLPTGINICDAIGKVFTGLFLDPLQSTLQDTEQQTNSILWTTPPIYLDSVNNHLSDIWRVILSIVDALIALVVVYGGLKMILGRQTLQATLSYANALDLIPRVILATLAAHFSLHFIQILIDGNNALCALFAQDHQLIGLTNKTTGQGFVIFLQVFYAIMGLLLLFQAIARDALLSLLMVLSPAWFFAWCLPETQPLARLGTTATIALTFLQALQLLVIDVGGHMIATLALGTATQFSLLNVLGGIAVLYVALQLPVWLGRWVLHSSSFIASVGDVTSAAIGWISDAATKE